MHPNSNFKEISHRQRKAADLKTTFEKRQSQAKMVSLLLLSEAPPLLDVDWQVREKGN